MINAEIVRKALRGVKDPELNLNIIDIGLVYDVEIDESGDVRIEMTLTSPGCPAGAEIIADVKRVVETWRGFGRSTCNSSGNPTGRRKRWTLGSELSSGFDLTFRIFWPLGRRLLQSRKQTAPQFLQLPAPKPSDFRHLLQSGGI